MNSPIDPLVFFGTSWICVIVPIAESKSIGSLLVVVCGGFFTTNPLDGREYPDNGPFWSNLNSTPGEVLVFVVIFLGDSFVFVCIANFGVPTSFNAVLERLHSFCKVFFGKTVAAAQEHGPVRTRKSRPHAQCSHCLATGDFLFLYLLPCGSWSALGCAAWNSPLRFSSLSFVTPLVCGQVRGLPLLPDCAHPAITINPLPFSLEIVGMIDSSVLTVEALIPPSCVLCCCFSFSFFGI